jgi:hypothetical protein
MNLDRSFEDIDLDVFDVGKIIEVLETAAGHARGDTAELLNDIVDKLNTL